MSEPTLTPKEVFMLKEYELLFARSEKAQENRWRFIQLFSVAISLFYAALFSRDLSLAESPALPILVWFPTVFAFIGLALSWGLREGMLERGNVMGKIEKYFDAPGWEGERRESHRSKTIHSPLTSIAYVFWILAISGTGTIAWLTKDGYFLPAN